MGARGVNRSFGRETTQPGRAVCCIIFAALNPVPATSAETAQPHYTCRPALPFFCRNIHVGCSGATTIPTSSIGISIRGATAYLDFGDTETPTWGQITQGRDLVIHLVGGRS